MKRTNITLRQRVLPSGRTSLYLDITSGGRRKNESLNLFLVQENNRADKQKNKETMRLAEAILAKRIVEAQNDDWGFRQQAASEIYFYEYFVNLAEKHKREDSISTYCSWMNCLLYIEKYDQNIKKRSFAEIDVYWITGFKTFLQSAKVLKKTKTGFLSDNSKMLYWSKLKTCFNSAVKAGIIQKNPMLSVCGFTKKENTRMYLTVDEVRKLSATNCCNDDCKKAFLFSCMTGLRLGDIKKLTWGDVQQHGDFIRIVFKQKKTGGIEYLDVTPQAAELMGERGKHDDCVFRVTNLATVSYALKKWVAAAGIDKAISFHCARHTFAVMMLDIGVDIYTVSKLLGHKRLETTQVYAKVLDKNKQLAVKKIPTLLK